MSTSWGSGDHGPGGDPSWLGGKDRGTTGGDDWSSDFGPDTGSDAGARGSTSHDSRADSDFGGGSGADASRYEGPEFGDAHGDEASGRGSEQEPGWAESFTGTDSDSGGEGSGKGVGAKVVGVLASLVGLVIFAVIAFRVGFDAWWIILLVVVPMITRALRAFGKGGRGR